MLNERIARRRLLKAGVASLAAGLAGCGSGGGDGTTAPPPPTDESPETPQMPPADTGAPDVDAPVSVPSEPAASCPPAPTPAFPSGVRYVGNGEERVDLTEGRAGATLELRLRFVDAVSCEPLSSLVVDLWNADVDGRYSSDADATTYGRGRQLTDVDGRVTFVTLYPGPDETLPPLVRFTALFGSSEAFTSALFMEINDAIEVYGLDTEAARRRGLIASAAYQRTIVPEALIVDPSGPISRRVVTFDVAVDTGELGSPPCESGSPACGGEEPVERPPEPVEPATPPDGGPPLIDPASAQAQALQYVVVAPDLSQRCGTCSLFQGAPGSTTGPCPLFPGLRTRAQAMCSAYVPRAS